MAGAIEPHIRTRTRLRPAPAEATDPGEPVDGTVESAELGRALGRLWAALMTFHERGAVVEVHVETLDDVTHISTWITFPDGARDLSAVLAELEAIARTTVNPDTKSGDVVGAMRSAYLDMMIVNPTRPGAPSTLPDALVRRASRRMLDIEPREREGTEPGNTRGPDIEGLPPPDVERDEDATPPRHIEDQRVRRRSRIVG